MDRREAIRKLGAGIGLAVLAPVVLSTETPQVAPDVAPLPLQGIGVLRFPDHAVLGSDGTLVHACQLAKQIGDHLVQGTILWLPGTRDHYGAYEWDFRIEGGDPKQVKIERGGEKKP